MYTPKSWRYPICHLFTSPIRVFDKIYNRKYQLYCSKHLYAKEIKVGSRDCQCPSHFFSRPLSVFFSFFLFPLSPPPLSLSFCVCLSLSLPPSLPPLSLPPSISLSLSLSLSLLTKTSSVYPTPCSLASLSWRRLWTGSTTAFRLHAVIQVRTTLQKI